MDAETWWGKQRPKNVIFLNGSRDLARKRRPKNKKIQRLQEMKDYKLKCDERLQTKTKEFTRLHTLGRFRPVFFLFCLFWLGIDISRILTRPACPTGKVLAACAKQDGILLLCDQATAWIRVSISKTPSRSARRHSRWPHLANLAGGFDAVFRRPVSRSTSWPLRHPQHSGWRRPRLGNREWSRMHATWVASMFTDTHTHATDFTSICTYIHTYIYIYLGIYIHFISIYIYWNT